LNRVAPDFDYVVIGHGLAGAAVARELRRRGRRLLVITRVDPQAASRVAAGLVTPFTGRRFARTWRFDDCYPAAVAAYRAAEAETGTSFFHEAPALRLFADAAERETARARLGATPVDEAVRPDWFAAAHGGVGLSPAARLDVPSFLDAQEGLLNDEDALLECDDLDAATDVVPAGDGVRLPRFGLTTRGVIFCQGVGGVGNPWFPTVPYNPAKGEMLTLCVPGLRETRTVHRGVWLTPQAEDVYYAGSTYDRDDLTPTPTAAGRAAIEAGLREFLKLPFEVLGHRAGVRPVLTTTKPMLGVHPRHRLAVFTGLGSKGVLYAPAYGAMLVDHLTDGRPIDPEVSLPPEPPC
jgi:glycine/D-amino acid oxidase-like deaminating enzyme